MAAARYKPVTARELQEATVASGLSLSGRRLTILPPDIGRLTDLQTLNLNDNELASLPPEIGMLTNLQTLDPGGNHLTSLPPEIGMLTNLQTLWVNGNRLTSLPPEIGQLTNLQTLNLADNNFASLPPEITQLTNLRELRLHYNQLTSLPREIGQLTNLQTLWVNGNRLTSLPPEIGQLTNLRELHLDGNEFASLPPEVTQLANLQTLYFNGNRLTSLPPEIGQLTNLRRLNVDGNQLTSLPRELAGPLEGGLSLTVEGNPLQEPLPELVKRGTNALATYLRSLEDAIPHYEAKILLVGEGNVGKTSLVAALRGDPFIEGRPTTHGIEIHPLTLSHPDSDLAMTLRAWDFGGQEVYRITHQFFFSPRALYLLVWNAREGQEQDEVEGWLRRIRLRVGHRAPTLLVATHCEERHPELDYPLLRQLFPGMLAGRYQVDNRSGTGIVEFRSAIAAEAARLPQLGQLLSPRWVAARDEILARAQTEPQIPFEEFVAVCERHRVSGQEITTLAELLHDLGQIVYYGNDEGLRDIVVLNPEWLTKAIGYVLEDTPTRRARGVLDHTRLKAIWQDRPDGPAYPARYHPYFLRLMEKFDVSYRLEENEHKSLVAQLVPHERPELPWEAHTPAPEGIRSLALVCQLREPAPGLMAWLTVRHHRASVNKHWRRGVFLRHPIAAYASEALLELRDDRHLAVEVSAPSPDLFFNVLRDSVEDLITRRWPGLDYQLLIPCPTRRTDGIACPGQFKLASLLRFREHGKTGVDCEECVENHDIAELLTGFALPPVPLQPELERLHSQLSKVESGVERLERYAADTADSMRRVLKAVASEITDCPRLFTLTPEQRTSGKRLMVHENHYRLVLWCEHPGQWHPWAPATYSLHQPKDWLVRVRPYATLVFKTLKLVVPIATAVAGVEMTEDQFRRAEHQLELMKTLVEKLPDQLVEERQELESRESPSQLTAAEGAALRALRVLLFEQDDRRAFGDLRRVQAPSGDFLWVCTTHYPKYDPGLPEIPDPPLHGS